jgi:hypothetical protein
MQPNNDRSRASFFALLGCSILACIITDIQGGVWQIHSGAVFPWRHLPVFPVYSHATLIIEWICGAIGGALLIAHARSRNRMHAIIGEAFALVATTMGLSQRFSNHRSLILIVLVFALVGGLDDREGSNETPLRAQLVIVYAFSVINKFAHGFGSGDALVDLFGWSQDFARIASWSVVACEIAIPILLMARRRSMVRAGLVLAIVLHASMAILMPMVTAFSFVMIALAVLFTDISRSKSPILLVSAAQKSG